MFDEDRQQGERSRFGGSRLFGWPEMLPRERILDGGRTMPTLVNEPKQ